MFSKDGPGAGRLNGLTGDGETAGHPIPPNPPLWITLREKVHPGGFRVELPPPRGR